MYIYLVISGIIFLILDKYRKSTIFLSLSMAFLFSSIITYKTPSMPHLGVVLLPAFYLISYLLITKILNTEKQNEQKESVLGEYKGKTAIVTKDIGKTLSIDGIGQIEFNNNLWMAKNITDKEIKKGTKVTIVSKENMILNVKAR